MLVRMENFREATRTRSTLHLTMIVAFGLARNEYSGAVQSVVTLDSIFEK